MKVIRVRHTKLDIRHFYLYMILLVLKSWISKMAVTETTTIAKTYLIGM
jgi:hypothetical protein